MLHISRFLKKKRSRDCIIVSQDLTSHSYTAGGWEVEKDKVGDVTIEGKKKKRRTCRERESCFAFFFLHETLSYVLLTLLSLAIFVLIDFLSVCLKG
jgi:hypothetical protein